MVAIADVVEVLEEDVGVGNVEVAISIAGATVVVADAEEIQEANMVPCTWNDITCRILGRFADDIQILEAGNVHIAIRSTVVADTEEVEEAGVGDVTIAVSIAVARVAVADAGVEVLE